MKKRILLMLIMLLALAMIAAACGGDDDDDGDDGDSGDDGLTAETVENALEEIYASQDPAAANAILCEADQISAEQAGAGFPEGTTIEADPSCEINDDILTCTTAVTVTTEGEDPISQDIDFAYRIVDGQMCGELDPETLEPLETE